MAQKNERITLGPGRGVYPALKNPDTKFDELGQYKADLSIPSEEAEPLMERLSEVFKSHTGKAPKKAENTMWFFETDHESGEETGNVVFKCRVKNKIRKKDGKLWDRKPKLFDAALKPIDVSPWGGSEYIVNAEIYCWDAGGKKGVSLQPVGVQIIKLIEGGSESAEDMGFSKRDDGYVADADESDGFTDQTAEAEDEEDDGDF